MADAISMAQVQQAEADTPTLWNRGRVDAAILTGLVAALMVIGLVMTFSASIGLVPVDSTEDIWQSLAVRRWLRQTVFIVAGLGLLLLSSRIPYTFWRWRPGRFVQPSVVLFLVTVVLLACVFVPGIGRTINFSRRWIRLIPGTDAFLFQPSELAKFALVVLLSAWYTSRRPGRTPVVRRFFLGTLATCLVIGALGGLVAKEDFGTGALLAMIGGMLFLTAGARLWHILLLSVPLAFGLYHEMTSKAYRMERLTMFTRIWDDPRDKGYHQVQSLCAIASGGWLGRGLGQGIQKYGYLPESTTDSVFAVVCEELGMPGALLIIGIFLAILAQGWRIFRRCPDPFGRFLAIGITLTIVFQAAFNIAVVTVSVPTKGIALPFVSVGGSGMLCLSVMMGTLANIARRRPE